jgi:hypothetical protein
MNQDGDNNSGEATEDQFTTTFVVARGPDLFVSGSTPTTNIANSTGLTKIGITFSTPIDPASFTVGDVTITGPQGQIVTPTAITPRDATNTIFDITVRKQIVAGRYTFIVNPTIVTPNGQTLDQDRDGIDGETTEDRYVRTFTINPALRIVRHTPSRFANPPGLTVITVTFNSAINASTFTRADVLLTTPAGRKVRPVRIVNVGGTSRSFQLVFSAQVAGGTYSLSVGSNITGADGGIFNQDGDARAGEATDLYKAKFVLPNRRPTTGGGGGGTPRPRPRPNPTDVGPPPGHR